MTAPNALQLIFSPPAKQHPYSLFHCSPVTKKIWTYSLTRHPAAKLAFIPLIILISIGDAIFGNLYRWTWSNYTIYRRNQKIEVLLQKRNRILRGMQIGLVSLLGVASITGLSLYFLKGKDLFSATPTPLPSLPTIPLPPLSSSSTTTPSLRFPIINSTTILLGSGGFLIFIFTMCAIHRAATNFHINLKTARDKSYDIGKKATKILLVHLPIIAVLGTICYGLWSKYFNDFTFLGKTANELKNSISFIHIINFLKHKEIKNCAYLFPFVPLFILLFSFCELKNLKVSNLIEKLKNILDNLSKSSYEISQLFLLPFVTYFSANFLTYVLCPYSLLSHLGYSSSKSFFNMSGHTMTKILLNFHLMLQAKWIFASSAKTKAKIFSLSFLYLYSITDCIMTYFTTRYFHTGPEIISVTIASLVTYFLMNIALRKAHRFVQKK